jgi:hypothetical protein
MICFAYLIGCVSDVFGSNDCVCTGCNESWEDMARDSSCCNVSESGGCKVGTFLVCVDGA